MQQDDELYKRHYPMGSVIFHEGDHGNSAYIIENGKVEISTWRGAEPIFLGVNQSGDIFGEMAIIDAKPRTATATALTDCNLIVISREQLLNHVEQAKPIMQMLVTVILERFRDTMLKIRDTGHEEEMPEILGAVSESKRTDAINHHIHAIDQIKKEQNLVSAINNDEFELHFQPIIDMKTKEISGFESLIRWNKPDEGLVYPGYFIETAEESGIVVEMGRWIMKNAAQNLLKLRETAKESGHKKADNIYMAVNVSGRQILDKGFVESFIDALSGSNLSPKDFLIEVTESMLMQDSNIATDVLKSLKKEGFRIALDDFGTGYSSLSYLHAFPIDVLKIDRSFISTMDNDKQSEAITRSIIGLGKSMGMKIVCEGIENNSQSQKISHLEADYGQGFYFSKPLTYKNASLLLQEWKFPIK